MPNCPLLTYYPEGMNRKILKKIHVEMHKDRHRNIRNSSESHATDLIYILIFKAKKSLKIEYKRDLT